MSARASDSFVITKVSAPHTGQSTGLCHTRAHPTGWPLSSPCDEFAERQRALCGPPLVEGPIAALGGFGCWGHHCDSPRRGTDNVFCLRHDPRVHRAAAGGEACHAGRGCHVACSSYLVAGPWSSSLGDGLRGLAGTAGGHSDHDHDRAIPGSPNRRSHSPAGNSRRTHRRAVRPHQGMILTVQCPPNDVEGPTVAGGGAHGLGTHHSPPTPFTTLGSGPDADTSSRYLICRFGTTRLYGSGAGRHSVTRSRFPAPGVARCEGPKPLP